MLDFLTDNTKEHVVVDCQVFQQCVGIPMGPNFAPFLADYFFVIVWVGIHSKPSTREKNKISYSGLQFDISTTYYLWITIISSHMSCRYMPMSWKSNRPQSAPTSALHLYILLVLDTNGKLITELYDKRNEFNFSIVNCPDLYIHVCICTSM
jgi:hypothetical protein